MVLLRQNGCQSPVVSSTSSLTHNIPGGPGAVVLCLCVYMLCRRRPVVRLVSTGCSRRAMWWRGMVLQLWCCTRSASIHPTCQKRARFSPGRPTPPPPPLQRLPKRRRRTRASSASVRSWRPSQMRSKARHLVGCAARRTSGAARYRLDDGLARTHSCCYRTANALGDVDDGTDQSLPGTLQKRCLSPIAVFLRNMPPLAGSLA